MGRGRLGEMGNTQSKAKLSRGRPSAAGPLITTGTSAERADPHCGAEHPARYDTGSSHFTRPGIFFGMPPNITSALPSAAFLSSPPPLHPSRNCLVSESKSRHLHHAADAQRVGARRSRSIDDLQRVLGGSTTQVNHAGRKHTGRQGYDDGMTATMTPMDHCAGRTPQ